MARDQLVGGIDVVMLPPALGEGGRDEAVQLEPSRERDALQALADYVTARDR